MIRPYAPNNKSEVIALLQLNIPKYFDPSEFTDFENYLDHELEDYFIYEEGAEIIGSGGINYFKDQKTARIAWDMIHPDHHGKGIGKKLVEHRIAHIRKQPHIESIIVRTSQLAYAFYQKMGFQLVSITKDHWAKGFDLYLMEMEL